VNHGFQRKTLHTKLVGHSVSWLDAEENVNHSAYVRLFNRYHLLKDLT